MGEILFQTHALCKNYNGKNVVDNVSLAVKKGDIYGFVGLNGAGKTTLMRMAAGLIRPTAGSLSLFGATGDKLDEARRKTASIIENPVFYPSMSGRENVAAYLGLLGKDKTKAAEYLRTVRLDPQSPKKARSFSLGMKQRLSIAMALAADAELLFLDEPTNGLDPEGMYEIRELLKYLNKERGVTIFISSHILSELEKLATTYGFIHYGRLIKEATLHEIEASMYKGYILEATDNALAHKIMSDAGVASNIIDGTLAIKGDINVSEAVAKLSGAGVAVLSLTAKHAELEDYFRNLIGGAQ
ncbi:MAG: ABC transporter ATP-binding protein [Firmicutes bacterium]|nr:ABC transporter ATP-binding protein [Bacillota bacterium]